jgi:alkaline phosphatase
VDGQTTDSAASATAIFSGVKTNIYTLGFDSSIVYQDPDSEKTAKKIETILEWAQKAGKETGQNFV